MLRKISDHVALTDLLKSSGIETEIIEVETAGDINKDAPIYEMGGTGGFVRDE